MLGPELGSATTREQDTAAEKGSGFLTVAVSGVKRAAELVGNRGSGEPVWIACARRGRAGVEGGDSMQASRLLVAPRRRCAAALRRLAAFGLLLLAVPVLAADTTGVTCEIRENGQAGSGTIVVLQGETEVGRGSCGKALALPAGDFTAV